MERAETMSDISFFQENVKQKYDWWIQTRKFKKWKHNTFSEDKDAGL